MIGRLLGNRYKILELIGEGGMALVYKAECTLLQRIVAVKVLRSQYSSDKEFVERFRREAQAAASLSHPNMVNIYDVGQEDDIHYIVMEYISGETLKDLIKREAPLSVNRTLRIALQIAEALRHAHERNIIHRDIKPHNILLTPEGRVKVTDFGIARAISAGGFTQTGVVMGSVQYFSPEQAKGVSVGPQSDLYSLGCVIYEMLTGEVPFEGESPISIALKHLQEAPPPIGRLRPDLPPAVVNILNRALAKDLSHRYPSARAMIKDVQAVLGLDVDSSGEEDYPTQVMKSFSNQEAPTKKNETIKRGKNLLILLFALLGAIVLFIIGYLYLIPTPPEVEVPTVVGLTLEEARLRADEKGLKIRIIRQINDEMPAGSIISQDPAAKRLVRKGRDIKVVISKGPMTVQVPDLTGKTRREAEIILEESWLKLGEVYTEISNDVPRDKVVRQRPPANQMLQKGGEVDLYLSLGPDYDKVEVPNFIGQRLVDVQAKLAGLGLVFDSYEKKLSVYPEGQILDQQPPAGSIVPLGTPLKFIISGLPEEEESRNTASAHESQEPRVRKEKAVEIKINQGPVDQMVKLILEDERGRNVVYEKMHHPGDSFKVPVEIYGQARIYIYINGVLSYDKEL